MTSGQRKQRAALPGFAVPAPFESEAPTMGRVTEYDAEHFIDYARMLDAERAGQGWREAAAGILRMDPAADEHGVRRCWDSHMARARWIASAGYGQLLAEPGLRPEEGPPAPPSPTSAPES